MEAWKTERKCKQCGQTFMPKYEWSKMCWGCWWASEQGKAYARRKAAESDGWDRDDARDAYARDTYKGGWDRAAHEEEGTASYEELLRRAQQRENQQRFDDAQARQARNEEARREQFRQQYWNPMRETAQGCAIDKVLLRKLLQLCHPDKHGGSKLAESVTVQLLEMKGRL